MNLGGAGGGNNPRRLSFSTQSNAHFAVEHGLPTMFILRYYVEDGGLMSYGVDFAWLMRRGASFVAKILRGAKPAPGRSSCAGTE
jgi:hypothetical protein